MANVKLPFVPSTSGWQPNVKWANSSIPVAAGICRASLGTWLKDKAFPDYWQQWRIMGIPRGAYHFLMNDYNAADQAKFFLACIEEAGGLLEGDQLIIDVEDATGEYSINAILDFLYHCQLQTGKPYEDMWIYSRQDIMNPLSFSKLGQAQKDILLKVKTWPAGYPNDPDPYSFEQLKSFYHFDATKYGPCVLVQYAESIEIPGINPIEGRSTECNAIDEAFLAAWKSRYGGTVPPSTGGSAMQVTAIFNLKVRSGPATTYSQVGASMLSANSTATVYELSGTEGSEQWARIGDGQWVNVWHSGTQNSKLSGVIETPPPPPATAKLPVIHLHAEGYPDVDWTPLA